MTVWNESKSVVKKAYMDGAGKLHGTLANTAVVDNGDGTVGIAITGHGLSAGNQILIAGTTNYDGVHTILSVGTNVVNVSADYTAETPAGTETYKTCFKLSPANRDFQMMEARLTLASAGGAAEAFTVSLNHAKGARWNATLHAEANMNAVVSTIWKAWLERRYFNAGDVLVFEYTNTNSRAWGLELIYRAEA